MWLGTLSESAIHETGDEPSFAYRATMMSSATELGCWFEALASGVIRGRYKQYAVPTNASPSRFDACERIFQPGHSVKPDMSLKGWLA